MYEARLESKKKLCLSLSSLITNDRLDLRTEYLIFASNALQKLKYIKLTTGNILSGMGTCDKCWVHNIFTTRKNTAASRCVFGILVL